LLSGQLDELLGLLIFFSGSIFETVFMGIMLTWPDEKAQKYYEV